MSQVRAIQLRRGTRAELDNYGPLLIGELGFCTDTKELFIGTPSGNILINPETIDWSKVTGKPGTFTPSSHSHAWGDITGKPSTFTPSSHSHAWGDITGKPSTFIPSSHSHSKSDVGLGSVQNYGIATQAQAQAGTVNNVYMTPLRVAEAISSLAPVKSVAGRTGAVTLTKSDVGLGNVQNYGIATQAQAEEGTANNVYMTPLRVAQAIARLGGGGTLFPVVAGDTIISQSNVGTKASSLTATKLFSQQIIFPIEGTLRISMTIGEEDTTNSYIQVYRNGVAVGVQHYFSSSGTTLVEDIPGWRQGDILEVYGGNLYGGSYFYLSRVTLMIGYGG